MKELDKILSDIAARIDAGDNDANRERLKEHYRTLLEPLINQEVEKRIAERMPSDELIEEIQEKSLLEYENAPICEIDYYSGFEDGVKWLRSRLTNQKTEGGGE